MSDIKEEIWVDISKAKLTEELVAQIKTQFSPNLSDKKLGMRYGVSGTAIRDIRIGRSWTHV